MPESLISLAQLNSSLFSLEKWEGGSLAVFNLKTRERDITSPNGKAIIRKHAIGYCLGQNLPVRPKVDTMAVMFETENFEQFWTHLTTKEFNEVFDEQ